MENKKVLIIDSRLKPMYGGGQIITNLLFIHIRKIYETKLVSDKPNVDPLYNQSLPGFNGIIRKFLVLLIDLRSHIKFKTNKNPKSNYKGIDSASYVLFKKLPKFLLRFILNKRAISLLNESDIIISNSNYDIMLFDNTNLNSKTIIHINHLPVSFESTRNALLNLKKICDKTNSNLISVVLAKKDITLSKNLGIRTYYIPNGIEIKEISEEKVNEVIKKFSLERNNFIFSIGRLEDSQKGFSLAIEAMSKVASKYNTIKYIIAGVGKDRDNYIQIIREDKLGKNVRLIGFVSEIEKLALMKACLAFVQPSYFEAFSVVTLEALSQGAIVLVSKNQGAIDVIEGKKNGFFIDLNSEDISCKIMDIINMSNKEIEKISKNAIGTSKEFSVDKMVDRYIKLIN